MGRYILTFLLLAVLSVGADAQSAASNKAEQHEQWRKEMDEAKRDYLIHELDLTREQKEKFFPVYNAMNAEIGKLNRDLHKMRRNLSKRTDVSDIEYEKAAEAMFEAKGKENAIEMKYFEQFKSILTKKQLFMLKNVEFKWLRQIMKHRKAAKASVHGK